MGCVDFRQRIYLDRFSNPLRLKIVKPNQIPKKKEITMGTQQILLIVLSVIIVGIGMFNRQAYNANRTAIASDAQQYASEVVQMWKTPQSQGGAGAASADSTAANMTAAAVAAKLGVGTTEATAVENDNGKYWTTGATGSGPWSVSIFGIGNAERGGKNPKVKTTVALPGGEDIQAEESEVLAP